MIDKDQYKIQKEPSINNKERSGAIRGRLPQRMPMMLKGPTGCGKSRFVEHMAWKLGRPLITWPVTKT